MINPQAETTTDDDEVLKRTEETPEQQNRHFMKLSILRFLMRQTVAQIYRDAKAKGQWRNPEWYAFPEDDEDAALPLEDLRRKHDVELSRVESERARRFFDVEASKRWGTVGEAWRWLREEEARAAKVVAFIIENRGQADGQ